MPQDKKDNPSEKTEKTKKKTPKWIKALEAQSWQAELLVSGLLIAGLLQLPDHFMHLIESYMKESSETGYLFLNIASMAFLLGIDCLIIFFGFHFLFRSIWIALLGLNSVYPEGIDVDSTNSAGPKFWKKAKEQYPDLSAFNEELDKRCSLIFSLATVIIIMMTSLSVIIMSIYFLFRLLISFFPGLEEYVVHIGIALYLLFTIVALLTNYLMKKYPDNQRIERYGMAISNGSSFLFSLYIFQKPLNYITNIYISNVKSKLFAPVFGIGCFLLGIGGAVQTDNYPIYNNLSAEKYITFNNKAYQSLPYNYEDQREPEQLIFTPIIPSDIIDKAYLKLFIPTIDREKDQMDLEKFSTLKKLKASRESRDSLIQVNLSKMVKFNQIFINDIAYKELDFQFHRHPNAQEKGLLTYIPTDNFIKGKNILEIRKNFFSKDSVQKIVKIPFYFETGID